MRHMAAAALTLAFTMPASAEIVHFEFSGVVNTIREYRWGETDRLVDVTDLPPVATRVGATFRGSFGYDTAVAPSLRSPGLDSYTNWPEGSIAPPRLTFENGWSVSASDPRPFASVANGATDYFALSGYPDFWVDGEAYLSFFFSDPTGKAFSSTALPALLDASMFAERRLSIDWSDAVGNRAVFDATVTRVSPVPEPAGWAMLGTALLGIGAVLRRRRV